jgi:hypothetical protein
MFYRRTNFFVSWLQNAFLLSQDESFMSVYRDSKPVKPLQNCAYSIEKDATGRHGRQLLEMLQGSEREMLHKIQTRGNNKTIFYLFTS